MPVDESAEHDESDAGTVYVKNLEDIMLPALDLLKGIPVPGVGTRVGVELSSDSELVSGRVRGDSVLVKGTPGIAVPSFAT